MNDRLRLWEIEVPFRRPLRTARGEFAKRHSVIAAFDSGDTTGWAEAPAFPSGRFGTATDAFDDLANPDEWVGDLPNVPIAAAALQGARADARARSVHVPLHRHLGADGRAIIARHPIGLHSIEDIEHEATWLRTHGIAAVKVKVAPGFDLSPIGSLRASMPTLDIGVDANGSYNDPADPVFGDLDDLNVSFIEQPFAASDLSSHATLRSQVRMAVCLDESISNVADVRHAIAATAADQIAVKLNRFGLEALAEIQRLCLAAGIGIQLGGTFDTAIGRRHLLAASGLDGVVDAAVGPPAAYLETDLATYPPLVDGMVRPDDAPGIGIQPDSNAIDAIALRSTVTGLG